MGAMMLSHVDKLSGALHALECSLKDSLRASYECHYGTVGRFARIHVEDLDSAGLLD